MDEIKKIKLAYEKRKISSTSSNVNYYFNTYSKFERELHYFRFIAKEFPQKSFSKLKFLEIGAGHGNNIYFFKNLGFLYENIFANELLEDRISVLKYNYPSIQVISGNALEISEFKNYFDIILISTVFSSILDNNFRISLANKSMELLNNEGILICYDFIYNNPANEDVKKVTRQDLRMFFNSARSIYFQKVTVFPYIGRKLGRFYNIFNLIFPFLRTHLISIIRK